MTIPHGSTRWPSIIRNLARGNQRYIWREKRYVANGDPVFTIRGKTVVAENVLDVRVMIPAGKIGDAAYPKCPDCGGVLQWNEAGTMLSSVRCGVCKSEFVEVIL